MKTMRIGYDGKCAAHKTPVLGEYSRYVVDALAANCKENEYIMYIPSGKDNYLLDEVLRRGEGRVRCLKPVGAIWRFFNELWRLRGVTGDACDDKVNVYHGLCSELPLNINGKIKSIVTIHDLAFIRYPRSFSIFKRHILNYKHRLVCCNANHIIAVSECVKRDIVKAYGISPGKVSVVYRGCSDVFAEPVSEEKRASVAARYNLPQRYILSVGDIDEVKNLLPVVKALRRLPEDVHLVAIGERRKYAERVERYIARKGLQKRVHLLSGVADDELAAIYRCAETFVCMSLYEGFATHILEAQRCGLPVVAATGSSLEEAGGEHSLYVEPNDAKGLAAAVMQCTQPAVRSKMILDGYKWLERFTPKNHAAGTMKCYRRVVED